VSVWPGTLALDYSPGDAWSAEAVVSFIGLLCALRDLTRRGRFVLAGDTSIALTHEQQLRFSRAVENYRGSSV
jgi:hypothetical protein